MAGGSGRGPEDRRSILIRAAVCAAAGLLWSGGASAAAAGSASESLLAKAKSASSEGTARRSLVRRSEASAEVDASGATAVSAAASSSLIQQHEQARGSRAAAATGEKEAEASSSSSRGRSKGPEFGQCEWHGFGCKLGTKDCQACTLTGLLEGNNTGAVYNEHIESGDFCVGTCHTGQACPARMQCLKGNFHPISTFQCLDLTGRCCAPYIANAPWPPCDQDNEGVVEFGNICTPTCKPGYTASEKTLLCGGSGGAAPTLSPPTFECIPDDFEAESA